MKRIEIDSKHKETFNQNGLNAFDDFIDCCKGEIINHNKKRNVSILRFSSHEGQHVYFMKRFFSPHLKDMFFTVRNFGKLCSQAELELRYTRILLENNIETYHPVCWGAETFCGVEKRSFFVTEKIRGQSLTEFLLDHWNAFDMVQRERLISELAQFFRSLHKAHLSLPDSYLWHLFLVEPIDAAKPYKFAIIDLHRMLINTSSQDHATRNLATFFFSMPYEWLDDRLRNLFLHVYLELSDQNPLGKYEGFLRALKKREKIVTQRRKKPDLDYLKAMI